MIAAGFHGMGEKRMRLRTPWWCAVLWLAGIGLLPPAAGAGENGGAGFDWGAVRVLDLAQAQRIALRDNPSIAAAEDRVRQARQRVVQARSAYWPRLDASTAFSNVKLAERNLASSRGLTSILPFPVEIRNPEQYYTVGLSATWLLFDGLEREFTLAATRFAEKESREARWEAYRLLLSAVASSYHRAQLAREEVAIAEANGAFNRRQAEDAGARLRIGTGSLSDELNFQVQVNAARSELNNARLAYRVAVVGLAGLLGIPDARLPDHVELAALEPETPEELVTPPAEGLIAYALENRSDVLQSEHLLAQAEKGVGAARARLFPSLAVSASLDGERTVDPRFEGDDFGNTVGVSLNYNLFSGGEDVARLREARARRDEARKLLASTRQTVAAEVRENLAGLRAAQEELVLQRANADLVRRNRDLVEKEYAAGQGSLVRLNEAQRDLTAAQGRLALALASLRQAWHDLETSTGEVLAPYVDDRD